MTTKEKIREACKILKASRVLFLKFLIKWVVERISIFDGKKRIIDRRGKFLIDWKNPQMSIKGLRAALFGVYEPHTERILKKYLKPGSIFIDVGANIGYFTFKAACLGAKVYAFEPVPAIYEHLKMVPIWNPNRSIIVENLALSGAEDIVTMMQEPAGGGSYIVKEKEVRTQKEGFKKIQVKVIDLDSYVARHGIRHIDLIKIDVEGYELEVLKGAKNSIEKFRPIIVCEVCVDKCCQQHREELADFIQKIGYQTYDIYSLEKKIDIRKYKRKLAEVLLKPII